MSKTYSFKTRTPYVLIGSDFSQQEPRLLAHYSQDENMINAYNNKQDLYASVAAKIFHNNYWDNMEHLEDGTPNPEGKKRRGFCKSVILGIMYGRGAASIAEQIKQSTKFAQSIIDQFYDGFPKVKEWVDKTIEDADRLGYVEDYMGRRRRIPDLLLPKYEIKNYSKTASFNPFLGTNSEVMDDPLISKYKKLLNNCTNRFAFNKIQQEAQKDKIQIIDNSGFKSRAERQCVNARVQGGAATMSKYAMIEVAHDLRLNEIGFRLLLAVHDELIGECPKIYAEEVAQKLSSLMISAAKDTGCSVNMKCDAEISDCWGIELYFDMVREEFSTYIDEGMTKQEAFDYICKDRTESTIPQLHEILDPIMNQ